MELSHIARAIGRYWLASLLALLCFVGSAAYLAYKPVDQYDATATLLVEPADTSVANAVSTVTFLLPALQVQLTSGTVKAAAATRVDPAVRATSVHISSATKSGTGILRVTATGTHRTAVASWANAYAEALISRQSPSSALHINLIDPASRATGPSGSARASLIVSGAVLGLIAAVVVALFAEALGRRRRIGGEIARRLKVPVLGEISQIRRLKGGAYPAADVLTAGDAAGVNTVLAARANVEAQTAHGPTSLCVTSMAAGEGSSTIVSTLAWALARAGREVVAVDADLRNPSLREAIVPTGGQVAATDLGVVVTSRTNASIKLISDSDLCRLAEEILLTDSDALHPPEILAVALPHALRAAEQSGALTLIDAPALVRTPDAAVAAGIASRVVVVVDVRRRGALARAEDAVARVREAGGSALGVVANRSRSRGGSPTSSRSRHRAAASAPQVVAPAAAPARGLLPIRQREAMRPVLSDSGTEIE